MGRLRVVNRHADRTRVESRRVDPPRDRSLICGSPLRGLRHTEGREAATGVIVVLRATVLRATAAHTARRTMAATAAPPATAGMAARRAEAIPRVVDIPSVEATPAAEDIPAAAEDTPAAVAEVIRAAEAADIIAKAGARNKS